MNMHSYNSFKKVTIAWYLLKYQFILKLYFTYLTKKFTVIESKKKNKKNCLSLCKLLDLFEKLGKF